MAGVVVCTSYILIHYCFLGGCILVLDGMHCRYLMHSCINTLLCVLLLCLIDPFTVAHSDTGNGCIILMFLLCISNQPYLLHT